MTNKNIEIEEIEEIEGCGIEDTCIMDTDKISDDKNTKLMNEAMSRLANLI